MKKLKDIKWKELILKNFGLKIIAVIPAIIILHFLADVFVCLHDIGTNRWMGVLNRIA